jgi:hypothetical protein
MFIFLQLKSFLTAFCCLILLLCRPHISSFLKLFFPLVISSLSRIFSDFSDCSSGIDGRVDTKLICGTTVARKKARAGKEGKVRKEKTTYL